METKRKIAFRDGLESWTEGDIFTAPGGEVVEVLYESQTGDKKLYFVELPGIPASAHGDTVEEAINDAREKRDGSKPLNEAEKSQYKIENYRFSVALFRRITGACRAGIDAWLNDHLLTKEVTMTLAEFKEAGGGYWADLLEKRIQ